MGRKQLNTKYIYCIRNVAKESVYRSSRNSDFVLKVRTLSMWS